MKTARLGFAIVIGAALAGLFSVAVWGAAPAPPPAKSADPPASQSSSVDAGTQVISVPGEVLVLHATNTDGGIDPAVATVPQLRKPPFSAFNTYKLISKTAITLSTAQPDSTKLPNGRVLRTTLLGTVPKDRYRISASISQPNVDGGRPSFLPLVEATLPRGESFFVAGQSWNRGVLVVGIKVGK